MNPRLKSRVIAMTMFLLGAMACQMAASAAKAAAIDVYVTVPPPSAPTNAAAPARPGYVWTPGYYAFRGVDYVWVEGGYVAARPGYVWVADRWDGERGRYRFVPGRWAR